jgi:predicted SnoaL-like aldol condensation-catalyzing enzyme
MNNQFTRRKLLGAMSLATGGALAALSQPSLVSAANLSDVRRAEWQNKVLFHTVLEEVFNQHQLEKVDQYYAADYIQHNPQAEPGREGVKAYFNILFAAFPDWRGSIDHLYAENNYVVAFITWEGTHKGEFYGIQPTGRYVQYKTADIARIKDGRIAEHWDVIDQYSFFRGLGVIEADWE